MIEIIDDLLSQEDYDKLCNPMTKSPDHKTGASFPWYITDWKDRSSKHELYNYQFIHAFYIEGGSAKQPNHVSPQIELIHPIGRKINIIEPLKIKANLSPVTPEIIEYELHTDMPVNNFKTAIYYVNSNNGYTLFENGFKVKSVANRICIFDGHIKHAASSCTDQKFRCVINFNYR